MRPLAPPLPSLALALCAALACTCLLAGCGNDANGKQAKAKRPAPVRVARAVVKDFPLDVRAVGSVQPLASVTVTPRVGGMITRQHVSDGQLVAQGDPLFQIDPRPLQAALREARARLARDLASLGQAERDTRRYAGLAKKNAVSQDRYEQARTDADSLRATVEMDRAAVDQAVLRLEFSDVRAPIGGQAGRVLIQRGAVVQADDSRPLLVINQISPIAADFSVPEKRLPAIQARMRAGAVQVLASPEGDTGRPVPGLLTALDNAVDKSTGTITLRAEFENADKRLWPGQFVRVVLRLDVLHQAVVVPSPAVRVGRDGAFVYTVAPDSTVALAPVVTGPASLGETVVASGLSGNETVVVEGHLRIKPGTAVKPSGQPPARSGTGGAAPGAGSQARP